MLKDAECFTHIYLRTGQTDMRLGIDGLLTVIGGQMGLDPTEPGSVFLFCYFRCSKWRKRISI